MINKLASDFLKQKIIKLEEVLDGDVISYYGPIQPGSEVVFKKVVEDLKNDEIQRNKVYIFLTTGGGSAEITERLVNILRNKYNEVNFIIPNYAYSAGTIFCMSGDNIYMNYYSVLGPVDPQVMNKDGRYVPALGYLDKVEELINLARNNTISETEYLILKDFDLAELKAYEQARDLTVDLLKEWLVKYKLKNWNKTTVEKTQRAEEIAKVLGDYSLWKSHGRPLDINVLRDKVKLKIEDFGADDVLNPLVNEYYEHFIDFIQKNNCNGNFFHTRRFI